MSTQSFRAVPFPKIENVVLRDLEPEESEKLKPVLQRVGFYLPLPHLASVIVAEYQGEIVGFGTAQLMCHVEPLFVYPEWRGTGLAGILADAVAAKLDGKPYICIAGNAFAEQICRERGMREVPGKVFVRD